MWLSGTVGGYRFEIIGIAGWYVGVGKFNTSSNTFSGTLTCDPMSRSVYCGRSGNYWCGSDAACVYAVAYAGGGSDGHNDPGVGSSNLYVTGVSSLPVTSVTQRW